MRPSFPGFRFVPSDSELIRHLARLLGGSPIDEDLILAFNVYTMDPGSLPASLKYSVGSEGYYFTERVRQQGGTGRRMARRAGAGTWKCTGPGTGRPVRNERGEVVGHVTHLAYYRDNEKASSKWVMDEYTLAGPQPPENENWAICRVKLNATTEKRMKRKEREISFPGDQSALPVMVEDRKMHQAAPYKIKTSI